MSHRRIEIRIPVNLPELADGPLEVAATLHLGAAGPSPSTPLLCLFPGGGYTRQYFDLQLPGHAGHSEAEHHVAEGFVVAAFDHLGIGESTLLDTEASPRDDEAATARRVPARQPLSLALMGAACDAAVRGLLARLATGLAEAGLDPWQPAAVVGIGQSMGGQVVAVAQGLHATFDGVAFLGSSFTRTRLALRPGGRHPPRDASPEAFGRALQEQYDMYAGFHWHEEPAEFIEADRPEACPPWRSRVIPGCGYRLMEPSIVAHEAAAIRVPVFLAYGEIDVTPEPLADVAVFQSSCDIRLAIVPRMAHMHNFAPTRGLLWRRMAAFVREVVAMRQEHG